jgi:hypothetical protein
MLLGQGKIRSAKRLKQRELEKLFRENPERFDVILWGDSRKQKSLRLGRAGYVKQYAKENLLLLDVDQQRAPRLERMFRVLRGVGIKSKYVRLDKTERGWHVVILMNRKVPPAVTVALQAIMGSDYKRETFNIRRVISGVELGKRWNLLFLCKVER